VTHFRDFTNRQTGMYRITTSLSDEQAAQVIRAGCHKQFCLKCRLWTVNGLATESAAEKSLIPCLEPCAILLEFARMAVRLEQGEKRSLDLSPGDAATIGSALQLLLEQSAATEREADFSSPANGRRIQRILEKLNPLLDDNRNVKG
jgi:4Fe-4S binding protein